MLPSWLRSIWKRKPAITGIYCSDLGVERTSQQMYDINEAAFFDGLDDETKTLYGKLLLKHPDRTRKLVRPYEDIVAHGDDGEYRQAQFERVSLMLLEDGARGVMERCKLEPDDIDVLIVNYMAGQTLPSLTAHIAGKLGLRDDIYTVNMGDMGCSAAGASLDVATRILRSESRPRRALVLSTEPVSNLFRSADNTGGAVGNSLFGEGCAAVVVSSFREPSLYRIRAQQRVHRTDADSLDAIKTVWAGGGPMIQLSKDIPSVAGKAIEANLKRLVPKLLSPWDKLKYLVTRKVPRWQRKISRWAIHPGGMSVLRGLQRQLRLAEADLGPSYRVFQERSNMSSPSVLYALDHIEKAAPRKGEKVMLMTFGSGFQVNAMVLEKAKKRQYERAQKFAVVAGGTSGIGLDSAKQLASEGYHVFIGSRRVAHNGSFERVPGATYLPLDVTDPESITEFVKTVWKQSFGIDALIVSSGIAPRPKLQGTQDSDTIVSTVNTNLTGAMMLVNAFLPKMRVRGKVVLLNSILGQIPLMGNAAYCATKAGLHHFAEAVGVELKRAGRGVQVHSLYPAYVRTPMLEGVRDGGRTFLKPVEPEAVTRQIARILDGKAREPDGFILKRDRWIAGFYHYLPGPFKNLLSTM